MPKHTAWFAAVALTLQAQSSPQDLATILAAEIQAPGVQEFQIRQFLSARVSQPKIPALPEEWTRETERMRRRLLRDVVFHGWPKEWVEAPLQKEEAGTVHRGHGYIVKRIRYEIVPGFQSSALLYEPEHLTGKVPAILNLSGHEPQGKAVEYQQKRCINYALKGMLALNVEWMGFGELAVYGNSHDFGAQLDLAGANAVGLFYLAMRKGLDYLDGHPNVDRSRLGVTGLSGGGWQTMLLSALDERVAVAVPVAGYGSLQSDIVRPQDTSQLEEDATDLRDGQDYPHLTAIRAPRPTLLIYNAEDTCCFRAPMVKPYVFDAVAPFFGLFNKAGNLSWHENYEPGTHNFQLDNRRQSYGFFSKHFGLPKNDSEIAVDAEIQSPSELAVGLRSDNLTILDVARKLARSIQRDRLAPDAARAKLAKVVRYKPVSVNRAWMVANTRTREIESRSYHVLFGNGLSATGILVSSIYAPVNAPLTIVLNDRGKQQAKTEVSDRINRGERVLALDLLFTGDAAPRKPGPAEFALLLSTTGERPLGLESAQLIGTARWLLQDWGAKTARIEATGMRSQLTALVAGALAPGMFSQIAVHDGIQSLAYLFDTPVMYRSAPDLFCLDLYRYFDLDDIAALSH